MTWMNILKIKMFPAYQDGPLQIGVDTAEHELAHDGGDGGKHQRATQDPSGWYMIG